MSLGLRLLKAVGESPFWKVTGRVHTALYRATGGRVGHSAGRITNLLLTTRGRRSGEERTVALAYLADGDRFVVVASNGGSDRHPAWWLNLRANPRARVEVGGRTVEVTAREATAEEHARLWPELKAVNPFYGNYERITERRIPVVVLAPV
ncbi:MAG: nitroreductase family deazaflavin-dependent oxidoreductase [Thermodesulfobacteriota bacterium]